MTVIAHPLATVPQGELIARAEADPLRPRFHFVSPAGWLNDPNGVSQWNGTYHLFYQYNPEGAFHHQIQWGHAISTDLVTWKDVPVALEPSVGPDAEGCWSGVLVNDGGTPTLVYSGRLGEQELPCVAVGTPDLLNWTKISENPVIAGPPAGVEVTAYRDHCVWREGTKWRQLIGSGIRERGGTAFLYESDDLRSWDYIGPLFIGDAAQGDPADTDWTGTMWECVDLFRAGGGSLGAAAEEGSPDVLVFSAWDNGDTRHSLYWTGRYDGDSFEPAALHRLDYGGRFFYAPQSFQDESGRRVMFGWMQEGRSDEAMVEAGWSGVMSLPRTVTVAKDGSLCFAPVPEVEQLRRDHRSVVAQVLTDASFLLDSEFSGNQLDLELDLQLQTGAVFKLGILASAELNDSGRAREETIIELGCSTDGSAAGTLRLDRTRSSLDSEVDVEDKFGPVSMPEGRVHLRVIVDRSAVEIFANGVALTGRIYPTLGGKSISLTAEGTAELVRFDAWDMADSQQESRTLFP